MYGICEDVLSQRYVSHVCSKQDDVGVPWEVCDLKLFQATLQMNCELLCLFSGNVSIVLSNDYSDICCVHFCNSVFKIQKRIIRIIMNSGKNASCWQLFKELNILPIQSQYIISIILFVIKNKDQFLFLNHKYITRQTWQYTKRVFIIQELISTIIYQQPLKMYLVIKICSD